MNHLKLLASALLAVGAIGICDEAGAQVRGDRDRTENRDGERRDRSRDRSPSAEQAQTQVYDRPVHTVETESKDRYDGRPDGRRDGRRDGERYEGRRDDNRYDGRRDGNRDWDRRDNDRRDGRRDWNDNNQRYGRDGRDGRWHNDRYDGRDRRSWQRRDWNNDWNRRGWTGRYDYRNYRRDWHNGYAWRRYNHGSRYVRPHGYRDFRWSIGVRMPSVYYVPDYYIDWRGYDLAPPPYGYHWVRVDRDVYLVDIRTGLILDVVYDLFY